MPVAMATTKAVQAGEKMPDSRAYRHRCSACAAPQPFARQAVFLRMGLHLRLGHHTAHSFICGGVQLALTLCHTANIARRCFGGDGFSFARWRGKSAPRRGRCAASGSVPYSTCFGLTPRSPAVWARATASFGGAVGLRFLPISAPDAAQKLPTVPQPNPQNLSVPAVGCRCHFPARRCGFVLSF